MGGIILGLYRTLPMWVEKTYTALYDVLDPSRLPDSSLRLLLTWSNYRFPLWPLPEDQQHWYGGCIGISILAIAGVGVFAAIRNRWRGTLRSGIPALGCLIGCLVLVFGYRLPVIHEIPLVKAVNPARHLVFLVFFVSCLAGFGLLSWHRCRKVSYLDLKPFTFILILTILDLGPTTFKHPFGSRKLITTWTDISVEQKERLHWVETPGDELPNYRTFGTMSDVYPAIVGSQTVVKARDASFNPLFTGPPLALLAHAGPFRTIVSPGLDQGDESSVVESLRYVENGYVFTAGLMLQNILVCLALQNGWGDLIGKVIGPLQHSPIIVAPKAVGWQYPVRQFRSWKPGRV